MNPPIFSDSHCHLDMVLSQGANKEEVLKRAQDAGILFMLNPGVHSSQFATIAGLASSTELLYFAVGVHPNDAADDKDGVEKMKDHLSHEKMVALGETGLDYLRSSTDKRAQRQSFEKHIELALSENLPLIVHSREAEEDTISMLKAAGGKARGVMHCFTGSRKMAEEALELGFYISFSGIVTFKNAAALQDVAEKVPMDRILIETDSPYLAPEPYRGKTNEPSYVVEVARKLASIHGVDIEDVAVRTTDNFLDLFDRVKRPMRITILGCGFSGGVPKSDGSWGICRRENPRNKRSRCTIAIEHEKKVTLVDAGPDIRLQLNRAGIKRVDQVLFTHDHADHVHGIDDLKPFGRENPVPCYGDRETLNSIRKRFEYCFQIPKGKEKDKFRPFCTEVEVDIEKGFFVGGLPVTITKQEHGKSYSLGFRFGKLAYSNDVSHLSLEQLDTLRGLSLWIVDCIGEIPHVSHSHLEQTLSWAREIKPEWAILTNLGNKMDYEILRRKCSEIGDVNLLPAYDCMVLYVRT